LESHGPDSADITTPVARPLALTVGQRRVWAAVVLVGGLGILGLAAWLTPDARGYGTHEQLGFGKCGMLVTTGLPCPTCGMTTAFAYTVRGRWVRAFLAQPAGFLAALATIACTIGAGWALVAGRIPPIRLPIITPYRLFWALLVLLLGAWAFKIVFGLLTGTLPERP
jgi:Na+-transporting NADH:ubiquinone oxidoreductase subunit NqrB